MASLLALKRPINSSSIFKTLTNPIGSISAAASSVFNPNPITTAHSLSSLRFFSVRQDCNFAENRNIKDHKRRLLVAKYEVERKLYKAFCYDASLPNEVREAYRYKLSMLPRDSSITRVRNRCVLTGRPRAVYRNFRFSRIIFRELANKGQLVGVHKASW